MTNRDFFASRLTNEIPGFTKVLRALPGDRLDYRPHERNTSAGQLAWQIVTEMTALIQLFDNDGTIDYKVTPPPATTEEMAAKLEESARTVAERAKGASDELWNKPGKFLWGGQVVWEAPVSELAWGFLFDMVHHRGQLTVYLRPMGGKVPAVYGPSADEQ